MNTPMPKDQALAKLKEIKGGKFFHFKVLSLPEMRTGYPQISKVSTFYARTKVAYKEREAYQAPSAKATKNTAKKPTKPETKSETTYLIDNCVKHIKTTEIATGKVVTDSTVVMLYLHMHYDSKDKATRKKVPCKAPYIYLDKNGNEIPKEIAFGMLKASEPKPTKNATAPKKPDQGVRTIHIENIIDIY